MRFATGVAVAAGAMTLLAAGCGGSAGQARPSPSASAPIATSSPSATSPALAPAPSHSSARFGYQPLYPFTSLAQVQAWQAGDQAGGHQPWHLSADQTALSFTQGYLGFTEISKVARHTISADSARVTVGLALPDGKISDAATIHLVKWGSGQAVPWEVVGTDDTTLTVDVPAYGTAVPSPVTVGGTITGVDENLRAEVHVLGSRAAAGSFCCSPAGGSATPYSFSVPFGASPGQVLTIVVHTGGHVAGAERFAVTGVPAR